jgi:hypothetical protein
MIEVKLTKATNPEKKYKVVVRDGILKRQYNSVKKEQVISLNTAIKSVGNAMINGTRNEKIGLLLVLILLDFGARTYYGINLPLVQVLEILKNASKV